MLEVNDHPSLDIYFSKEFMGPKPGEEDIDPCDLYVKGRVLADAIQIARQKTSKDLETFNSLERILPAKNDPGASAMNELVVNIRELFYKLTPVKNKAALSNG